MLFAYRTKYELPGMKGSISLSAGAKTSALSPLGGEIRQGARSDPDIRSPNNRLIYPPYRSPALRPDYYAAPLPPTRRSLPRVRANNNGYIRRARDRKHYLPPRAARKHT